MLLILSKLLYRLIIDHARLQYTNLLVDTHVHGSYVHLTFDTYTTTITLIHVAIYIYVYTYVHM